MSLRLSHRRWDLGVLLIVLPMAAAAGMEATRLGTRYGLAKVAWVLAAGLGALFVARSRQLSLPLLMISLAFIFTTKKLFGIDLHLSQGVELVVVVQFLAAWYAGRVAVDRRLLTPLGLIAFGALVASVAGPFPRHSLVHLAAVLIPALLLVLATASTPVGERDLRMLVLAVMIALVGTGLLGLYQKAGGALPAGGGDRSRVGGLFGEPNSLGDFVASTILLLAGVATVAWRRLPGRGLAALVPIAVGLPTIIFTSSRGSMVGLFAGLLVIIACSLADRRLVRVLVVAAVVVGGLAIAFNSISPRQRAQLIDRVQNTQLSLSGATSNYGRGDIYSLAVTTIRQHPLTGVGPLAFGGIMDRSALSPSFQGGGMHAHNILLEGYLSLGPLGLLAFLWLAGGAVARLWRARSGMQERERPLAAGWAVGSLAALACLAVHGIVDFVLWQPELLMFYFMLFGLAYSVSRPRPSRDSVR